ncbi:hypothetical protein [Herbihabitans rhizosphaerae]|uniref:hypothetical protein n=1 Tax=Herbihabitans rhizosphaerae TaxID=1872711 RepID=UPI00102C8E4E|nr:hypothetical protein [Herbihabitans rhizosphaerae]
MSVLFLTAVAGLVVAAVPASAETVADTSHLAADESVPFGLDGPVGVVAVSLGIVGLIFGLVRRGRNAVTRISATRTSPSETLELDAVLPDPGPPTKPLPADNVA